MGLYFMTSLAVIADHVDIPQANFKCLIWVRLTAKHKKFGVQHRLNHQNVFLSGWVHFATRQSQFKRILQVQNNVYMYFSCF